MFEINVIHIDYTKSHCDYIIQFYLFSINSLPAIITDIHV